MKKEREREIRSRITSSGHNRNRNSVLIKPGTGHSAHSLASPAALFDERSPK
ncbi:hypothetical protein BaRGS_00002578, partial [Batillaria attramentaria]